jgi:hypothetical protein
MRWIVQTNLINEKDVKSLEEACEEHGYEFYHVTVVPFSDAVPCVDDEQPTIFYGATGWIDTIYKCNRFRNGYWDPGVYFNSDSTYPVWTEKYDKYVLNDVFQETTLLELAKCEYAPDMEFFVRPSNDQKAFAGNVMRFSEIQDWGNKLFTDETDLGSLPIIVAEPLSIAHEWRLFMVDGKVSSGSHYRAQNRLSVDPNVADSVIEFAEKRATEYSPEPVFVMDIGQCGGRLYVIEVGCFNSSGFYASDISKIVKDVSEYILEGK